MEEGLRESVETVPAESLEVLVANLVSRLKEEGAEDARSLTELLQKYSVVDVLGELRQASLEQGFSVLRRMIADDPTWRESLLHVVADAGADTGTRLFALRLLPSFAELRALERSPLLRQAIPDGELGRQLVRFVGKDPGEEGVGAWLSQVLICSEDPEVQADALRALVRCPDPLAAATLKRCVDDPAAPVVQKARILAALTAPGAADRFPWLLDASEKSIRWRPGATLTADEQRLASYALSILAQSGEVRRLSCLIESEKYTSDPGARALIAFGLRWNPEREATSTMAAMAANREESPKVRLLALESLRGRKSDDVVQRLGPISSEQDLPEDIKAALEDFLSE
jgi:hypothetical protein